MDLKRVAILLLAPVLVLPLRTQAQSTREPQAAVADETLASPPTQSGQGTPLEFLSDSPRASVLSGGLNFSGMYTSNAALSTQPESDVSYLFQPFIALRQYTPRLTLDMSGNAGFIVNQRFNERNQAQQSAAIGLSYRLRRYVTLRLDNTFSNTMGLFNTGGPGNVGVIQQPNGAVMTPAAHTLNNTSLAELNYQYSASSEVGVRGVVSILRYPDGAPLLGDLTLTEGQAYSAEGYYNRRLSLKHWMGVTLRAQRFDSAATIQSNSGTVLFLYTFQPARNLNFSLFGGPQLTMTHVPAALAETLPPFEHRRWSPATGASFGWQGHRTSASLAYVRQVNDGGGLYSAVLSQSAQGTVRRQLSRNQSVSASFSYGNSETTVPGVILRSYLARMEYSRNLTRRILAGAGYAFSQENTLGGQEPARAHSVLFSLSYVFTRRLGG